jgi:hypothetical protein
VTGRLPSFLIGGAPRSGTTWFAAGLDLHPDIWMVKPFRPEPKFFLVDETYARGLDAYSRACFAHAPDVTALGEKSTNYLESAAAAQRIADDLPNVRMLFVLRDPVTRAISNYRWSVMNGMEHADFETALRLEDERERRLRPELRYARPHAYFSRGCYADHLAPYFARLPSSQILCLRYEDLVTDPEPAFAAVHRFLGVEHRDSPIPSLDVVNESSDFRVSDETVERLRVSYEPHNQRLGHLLGPSFRLWDPAVRR